MAVSNQIEHHSIDPTTPVEAERPPRNRIASRRLQRFGLIGPAVVVLAGTVLWLHGRNRESTDDAEVVKIVFDSLPPGVVLRPGMNVDAMVLTK